MLAKSRLAHTPGMRPSPTALKHNKPTVVAHPSLGRRPQSTVPDPALEGTRQSARVAFKWPQRRRPVDTSTVQIPPSQLAGGSMRAEARCTGPLAWSSSPGAGRLRWHTCLAAPHTITSFTPRPCSSRMSARQQARAERAATGGRQQHQPWSSVGLPGRVWPLPPLCVATAATYWLQIVICCSRQALSPRKRAHLRASCTAAPCWPLPAQPAGQLPCVGSRMLPMQG